MPKRTKVPTSYAAAIATLRPPLMALTTRDWSGGENLPESGGFVAAANHLSEIDPLIVAHYLVDHGCPPLFLAKASLFKIPLVGPALKGLGQVPVHRGTSRAVDALAEAEQAVLDGSCVAIMPEGTLTRDPDLWPMRAHVGVARLALVTRAPVIPIAQWGAQKLLAPYANRPTGLFSRHTMQVTAGPAVPLDDLFGREDDAGALREATDRVMAAITVQLARLRGEEPPEKPFVYRRTGQESGRESLKKARRSAHPPASAESPESPGATDSSGSSGTEGERE
ncbi:lysophospholipid acyltransferase family protein [Ornithinicoccus hortensis]|uniref:1-acyl-sn-glycerol-3-phosphate acyltransferase n=2 Tax=Ornithinicoccus hortensis TaxID=82346 RepID=A0A542YRI5_9MICO|nr:1-acyl-sn-glycerol-3-phosphate acyltransferase [Ornithinicoccus hortensis]